MFSSQVPSFAWDPSQKKFFVTQQEEAAKDVIGETQESSNNAGEVVTNGETNGYTNPRSILDKVRNWLSLLPYS